MEIEGTEGTRAPGESSSAPPPAGGDTSGNTIPTATDNDIPGAHSAAGGHSDSDAREEASEAERGS